jgi:YidC/Oxa1 family membrane protein insertase
METLGKIGSFIMTPLYWLISLGLVGVHRVFAAIFGMESGISWVLAIIGLTILIRAMLIPLFVKQINASRNMALLQPKVKELQKKYGHDRERLAQETMQLYRDSKTNPLASCMPILIQMPIFLALFRLISNAAKEKPKGILTETDVKHLSEATIFGAKISESFTSANSINVQILAGVLVVAMTVTTFITQRQLMAKNMPPDAMTGPYAQQQKMLLYVLPVVFAVSGVAFPIGLLLYWTTSNIWTMGQQFYVIRNNPAPGTPAFEAKRKRDLAKGKVVDEVEILTESEEDEAKRPAQRQQPKKQSRQQRKKSGGK